MKTRSKKGQTSSLGSIVLTASVFMSLTPITAWTEEADDEVLALTQPQNFIEFGAIYNSDDSVKHGEYSGLDDSGVEALGNLSIRGGDAYDGGDGTMRWGIIGTDLGQTSRSVTGSVSNQGLWDISIGYDELQHNLSDTYQTPQRGSLGGNNFTLPANFGTIDGSHGGVDAPFDAGSTRLLTATQLGAFHTEDIHSDRDNISFGAGYIFNKQWSMKFDFNHLDQSGAKLIGTGNQGGIAFLGGDTTRGEANNIIMNPTEYTTDTINLALNWQGQQGHFSVGYFGSLFNDKYNSLSWQSNLSNNGTCVGAGSCNSNNTMSTAPDNEFHQFNLTGGFVFSPKTKLAGGFSYGINTQDDSYAPTLIAQPTGVSYNMMQAGGLPRTSLDGEVHNIHGDLKFTHKATRDLMLRAGFKYNERDNRTTSNTYLYHNLGNSNYTGVNLPYSNRKIQAEAAADYRITKAQKLHVGYEHEYIERWCDGVVGGAECVVSPDSDEDKLDITYRVKANEDVRFNVGYVLANRYADFNHTTFSANTGSYPVLNAEDKPGFNPYIYDTRLQNTLKGGVNWQATRKLDWSLNGRYSDNHYDAALGVQDSQNASVNLDATYLYSENQSFSAYVSWQNADRDLRSAKDNAGSSQIWNNQLKQDSYAIGLNTRHSGMMDDKLEVLGDVSYSFDTSHYSTQKPYDFPACSTTAQLDCGDTPDIETSIFTLKIDGTYKINETGKLRLGYRYQLLDSEDYYFNGYQYGYTPDRVLPTNEQAYGYSNHLVYMSYIYNF